MQRKYRGEDRLATAADEPTRGSRDFCDQAVNVQTFEKARGGGAVALRIGGREQGGPHCGKEQQVAFGSGIVTNTGATPTIISQASSDCRPITTPSPSPCPSLNRSKDWNGKEIRRSEVAALAGQDYDPIFPGEAAHIV